jgi:hypothetical protein
MHGQVGLAEDLDEELRTEVLAFGTAAYISAKPTRIANSRAGRLGSCARRADDPTVGD